jgi:hypothetical protein
VVPSTKTLRWLAEHGVTVEELTDVGANVFCREDESHSFLQFAVVPVVLVLAAVMSGAFFVLAQPLRCTWKLITLLGRGRDR